MDSNSGRPNWKTYGREEAEDRPVSEELPELEVENYVKKIALEEAYRLLFAQKKQLETEVVTLRRLLSWVQRVAKIRKPTHANGCSCPYCVNYRDLGELTSERGL